MLVVKLLHIYMYIDAEFLATNKNLVALIMVVQSEHAYRNYGSYACTQVSHNLELLDGLPIAKIRYMYILLAVQHVTCHTLIPYLQNMHTGTQW